MYSVEEVKAATANYFNGNDLATDVWMKKYALRNKENQFLEQTPDDMHWRLAREFARIEQKYPNPLSEEVIYSYLKDFRYLCVSQENWIMTTEGARQVKELINVPFIAVVNNQCFRSTSNGFVPTGLKRIFQIHTKEGFSLQVTEDHPILKHIKLDWYLKKTHTSFVKAKDLKKDDKIVIGNQRNNYWKGRGTYNEGWLIGNLIGDGSLTESSGILYCQRANTNDQEIVGNILNQTLHHDKAIIGSFNEEKVGKYTSSRLANLAREYGITKQNKFDLTKIEACASSEFCCGLLSGLFDADAHYSNGEINSTRYISLSSIHLEMLQQVQRILQRIGIISRIYINRKQACAKTILGVETNCQAYHDLYITKDNILEYSKRIQPLFKDKIEKLEKLIKYKYNKERFAATIATIIPLEEEQVYDCSIEHIEAFECNGIIVHNCPQGSPMSAIGNPYRIESTSNCFVLQPAIDSVGGIFKTDQELAHVFKRRGGGGVDISNLRPKGVAVSNAAQTTDGIAPWMEKFSETTRAIGASGRRAALMITISVHHPEIETFITIKNDLRKVTGANISIRCSDEFMNAVKTNSLYEQRWPIESPIYSRMVSARDVWNKIIHNAWSHAEPGIAFDDTIKANTPSDAYPDLKTLGCNPCSEIWMGEDSCRLFSINLTGFVKNPFEASCFYSFEDLRRCVSVSQRLMDDLVDIEIEHMDRIIQKVQSDPEVEEIKQIELHLWNRMKASAIKGRRTGLGITGLADVIAALRMKYGSMEGNAFVKEIYKNLEVTAYETSIELAAERGAFGSFSLELERNNKFISKIVSLCSSKHQELYQISGRRNVALTTSAPTGSISLLCKSYGNYFGVSSGIEPVFDISFKRKRKVRDTETYDFIDPLGDKWQSYIVHHSGYQFCLDNNYENYYLGALANNLKAEDRVDLQAQAQEFVCHAISSTLNVPETVKEETISSIYMAAWEKQCKGITVYRDNCRTGVLTHLEATEQKPEPKLLEEHHAPKRPEDLFAKAFHLESKGNKWTLLVGLLGEKPFEIFLLDNHLDCGATDLIIRKHDKQKRARYSLIQAKDLLCRDLNASSDPTLASLARMTSLSLRHGVPLEFIVEQLNKAKHTEFSSLPALVARQLKQFIPDKKISGGCPECKLETLIYQEGCLKCTSCGYAKCG